MFSIEELYRSIATRLRQTLEVVEYELGPRWRLPLDVWRLRRLGADVYHVTGDTNYMALFLPWKRTVLTLLDLGHYLHGLRGPKRWLYRWIWLELPARCASIVVAISANTRRKILDHLSADPSKVRVIPCCHGPLFVETPRKFRASGQRILQVGTQPYKNVPRVVEALRGLGCRLVLVGHVDDALRCKLEESAIEWESHVDLSPEAIFREYVACDAVSFVSLHEGFGVPIIEAQATGRPVVTSCEAPMDDVAGPGACLVDPRDVEAIRSAFLAILRDPGRREALVEQGLLNAKRFSPAAVAPLYLALYGEVASRGRRSRGHTGVR